MTTFQQSIKFPGASAEVLFEIYLGSRKHAAAIGAPAWIEPKVGGRFKIFGDDAVRGTNLAIIPGRLVVQAWRGEIWAENDPDSIVVLRFGTTPNGARIDLAHLNVPGRARDTVNARAWSTLYWKPWKSYLASLSSGRPVKP